MTQLYYAHLRPPLLTVSLVTLEEIREAAARIAGVARRTPVIDVGGFGEPPFALKCENMQPAGAFKIRGACNMIAQLPAEARAAGVITYSSGNHGQAMALAARTLGIRAVVVMPETAPRIKADGARRIGGVGARADDGAAVRSSVDHRGPGDVRARDRRAVSNGIRRVRADGRRRAGVGDVRGGQFASSGCSGDRGRAGRRAEDDRITSGGPPGDAAEEREHR